MRPPARSASANPAVVNPRSVAAACVQSNALSPRGMMKSLRGGKGVAVGPVGDGDADGVSVGVSVGVADGVAVSVSVGVGVKENRLVGVIVGVSDGVGVSDDVAVGDGVNVSDGVS